MKTPLLTVCLITYNHAQYIKQSIDSVLEQKTNFPWQLVIADDYSTDGTRDILKKYQKKYPERIRLILQKKNVGAEANWTDLLAAAKSKYVAYGEGDDYYVDPTKLQKQVDFLENNQNFSICFHAVNVVYDDNSHPTELFPTPEQRFNKTVLMAHDLLANNFMQTNSVMYRWRFVNQDVHDVLPKGIIPGDWYLHLYHAQFGKIGFIEGVMSVYRRHPSGLWWDQHKKPEQIWKKYGYNFLLLLHHIMLLYGDNAENRKIISRHIAGSYEAISSIKPQDVSDSVAVKSISGIPSETWDYMKQLMQQVDHYAEHEAYLQGAVESEKLANKLLSDELQNIKSSKLWKAGLVMRFGSYSARHPVGGIKRIAYHIREGTRRR